MYTVYKLEEELSPTGMPYIGCSKRMNRRPSEHKKRLGLSYTPKLIELKTFDNPHDAFEFEQEMRVKNGWKRETSNSLITSIVRGNKAVESGHLDIVRRIKWSDQSKIEQSNRMKGNTHSKESGKKSCGIIYKCPQCNKEGIGPVMFRHHFDNCKQKKAPK
jgi:predicted GIY-YIG superfamily endonuclease